MKYAVLLLFILAFTSAVIAASASLSTSDADYEKAMRRAKLLDQKVLIIFSMKGCQPCAQLKRDLAVDPEVKITTSQYQVITHIVSSPSLMPAKLQKIYRDNKVSRFPTTVVIDPKNLKYESPEVGYSRSKWLSRFVN
jgi:thioredoxin-related protein